MATQMRMQTLRMRCRCKSMSRRLRASSEPVSRRLLSSRMPSSRTPAQGAIRPPSLPGDACTLSAGSCLASCSQRPASVPILLHRTPLVRKRCYSSELALNNPLPCMCPWHAILMAQPIAGPRATPDSELHASRLCLRSNIRTQCMHSRRLPVHCRVPAGQLQKCCGKHSNNDLSLRRTRSPVQSCEFLHLLHGDACILAHPFHFITMKWARFRVQNCSC